MEISAAVADGRGGAFEVERLELGPPRPDELLVRVAGVGLCATDLHIASGETGTGGPVVAGHEAAGIVEAVGGAVSTLRPGDRVILTYPHCGRCPACATARHPYCDHGFHLSFAGARLDGTTALARRDGTPVRGHIFQQSSFATHALATERNAVQVPERAADLPLQLLGPLGCSMQTGAGAVLNSVRAAVGSTVVVAGTGSVGLAAVMAASAAGAAVVIAADIREERLEVATRLGATHAVNVAEDDLEVLVRRIAPRGADHVIDTTASPAALDASLRALAMGGTAVLVGGAPVGTSAGIDMTTLLNGRRLQGVIQGDAVSRSFLPLLLDLHLAGRFPFDQLVRYYDLADVNVAAADMRSGRTVKPVLLPPSG